MLRRFLTLVGAVGVLGALASVASASIFPGDGGGGGLSRSIADTLYCALTGCTMTGQTVYSAVTTDITTGTNEVLTVAPNGYSTGAAWTDIKGATLCEPGASDYGLVVFPEANGRAIKLSADSTQRITDSSDGPTLTLLVKKGTQTDNEIGSWATSVGNVTGAPLLVRDSNTQFVSVDGGVIDTIDIANQRQVLNGYLVVNQTSGVATHGATIEADTNGRGVRIVAPTNYSTSTFVSTGYGISFNLHEGATTNNVMSSFSNSNVGTVTDMWHQAANTIWSNTTTQQAKLVNSTGELDLGPTTQQLVFVPSTGTISTAANGNLTLSPGQHSGSGNGTIINGLLRDIADNGNTGFVQVSDNLGRGIEICGASGWTGTGGGTCAASGVQMNVQQSGGTTINTLVSYSNHSTATKSAFLISSAGLTLDAFGTGLLHTTSAGVVSAAAVTLSGADVTGVLPVANGGTNLAYAQASVLMSLNSFVSALLATNTAYTRYTLPAHAYTVQAITGNITTAGATGTMTWQVTDGTNTCDCTVGCGTTAGAYRCTGSGSAGTGCVFASSATLTLQTKNAAECTVYPTMNAVYVEGIWQ